MGNRLSKIISDDALNKGIQIESAGNPDARAGTSSAAGLGQFLTGTWQAVGQKHYPDRVRAAGAAWAGMRVGRSTAPLQLMMMARFWEDNARIMGSTRDGDLYLSHFLGAGGAQKVVRASQTRSAVEVCGERAANANKSIFYKRDGTHRTCGELRAWADESMRTRWEKAGRKDWIGIWLGAGSVPAPPDVPPVEPRPKPPGTPEIAVGTGAVVIGGGGAAVAKQKGVEWGTIVGFGVAFAVIVVAVVMLIRAARRSGG